jgi:hypothetical protein
MAKDAAKPNACWVALEILIGDSSLPESANVGPLNKFAGPRFVVDGAAGLVLIMVVQLYR